MKLETPEIKKLPDREVAVVSFKGNYIANQEVFKNLFSKLCGWAGPKGLFSPDTLFIASYVDDPETTPVDELRLDLCMTIPPNTSVEGEIKKMILPGGKYAVMHTELTNPKEYMTAWNSIAEWVKENNFKGDYTRPCYEIYLNDPEQHPEKLHLVDICVGLK